MFTVDDGHIPVVREYKDAEPLNDSTISEEGFLNLLLNLDAKEISGSGSHTKRILKAVR